MSYPHISAVMLLNNDNKIVGKSYDKYIRFAHIGRFGVRDYGTKLFKLAPGSKTVAAADPICSGFSQSF